MRSPEEIRRRNRRLDIAACALMAALVAAIVLDSILGLWYFAVVLVIALGVTLAMTVWRYRAYRAMIR